MRIAVLSGKAGWHLRDLERAGGELGMEVVPVDLRTIGALVAEGEERAEAAGHDLAGFDRLLVRAMPAGTLEQIIYRMDVLGRAAARGLPVVNPPSAVECAVDKYLALARMAARGLPVPRTRISVGTERALEDFAALGGDVVVKPIFGSEGRGMMRLSDPDLAVRAFTVLERIGAVIYQQEFVPHPGWDLRALVIGGRVAAAIRRRVPEPPGASGNWRTNLARGGRAEPAVLPPAASALAIEAAAAVGTSIAGVDLLPDRGGRLRVIEVNAAPGWRGLAAATGFDAARAVLEHLRDLPSAGGSTRPAGGSP